jgi:hypothetical protein
MAHTNGTSSVAENASVAQQNNTSQTLTLDDQLRTMKDNFSRHVRAICGEFRVSVKSQVIDDYFTDVMSSKRGRKARKTARQYVGALYDLLSAGWQGEENGLHEEANDIRKLYMENFPRVQQHLPLKYSRLWIERGIDLLREYICEKEQLMDEGILSKQSKPRKGLSEEQSERVNVHKERYRQLEDYFSKVDEETLGAFYEQSRGWLGKRWDALTAYFHRDKKDKKEEGEETVENKQPSRTSRKKFRFRIPATGLVLCGGLLGYAISEIKHYGEEVGYQATMRNILGSETSATSTNSAVKRLNDTITQLNTRYNLIVSALESNDVNTLRTALCEYLDNTVNGQMILYHTPKNPAFDQLFDNMVGLPGGRDQTQYEHARDQFTDKMKGVFSIAGNYTGYVHFSREGCDKLTGGHQK